jgi:hypothetical protein
MLTDNTIKNTTLVDKETIYDLRRDHFVLELTKLAVENCRSGGIMNMPTLSSFVASANVIWQGVHAANIRLVPPAQNDQDPKAFDNLHSPMKAKDETLNL